MNNIIDRLSPLQWAGLYGAVATVAGISSGVHGMNLCRVAGHLLHLAHTGVLIVEGGHQGNEGHGERSLIAALNAAAHLAGRPVVFSPDHFSRSLSGLQDCHNFDDFSVADRSARNMITGLEAIYGQKITADNQQQALEHSFDLFAAAQRDGLLEGRNYPDNVLQAWAVFLEAHSPFNSTPLNAFGTIVRPKINPLGVSTLISVPAELLTIVAGLTPDATSHAIHPAESVQGVIGFVERLLVIAGSIKPIYQEIDGFQQQRFLPGMAADHEGIPAPINSPPMNPMVDWLLTHANQIYGVSKLTVGDPLALVDGLQAAGEGDFAKLVGAVATFHDHGFKSKVQNAVPQRIEAAVMKPAENRYHLDEWYGGLPSVSNHPDIKINLIKYRDLSRQNLSGKPVLRQHR